MNKGLMFGTGVGLGTGLMFLLDPARGKRRRALLRDKCVWSARRTGEVAQVTARDLRNRAQGIASSVQSSFRSEPVDDSKLTERVRSKLGRYVSHPGAIEVTARDGVITLAGPILTEEVPHLLSAVSSVSGVKEVINNLESHDEAENHPALQGGRQRPGSRFEFMQENWSPAARFIAGAVGASLAAYGGTRRGALGAGLGTAGLLLLARGVTNTGLSHLWHLGSSEGDGAIEHNRTQQPSAIQA